jgi:hypothetical protein
MPHIASLEITIGTGDDDLRGDSSATAYLLVEIGHELKEYSTILKQETDSSWNNDTTNGPIVWNLPPGITDRNLKRFGIRLQSHPNATETQVEYLRGSQEDVRGQPSKDRGLVHQAPICPKGGGFPGGSEEGQRGRIGVTGGKARTGCEEGIQSGDVPSPRPGRWRTS